MDHGTKVDSPSIGIEDEELVLETNPPGRCGSRRTCLSERAAQVSGADANAWDDETRKLAGTLKLQVPGPLLEQVGELSARLSGRVGNGLISSWRTIGCGTDEPGLKCSCVSVRCMTPTSPASF